MQINVSKMEEWFGNQTDCLPPLFHHNIPFLPGGRHKETIRMPKGSQMGARDVSSQFGVCPRGHNSRRRFVSYLPATSCQKGSKWSPKGRPKRRGAPVRIVTNRRGPPLQRLRIDSPIQRPIYTSQSADPPATSPTSSLIPGRSYASQSTDPPTTSPTNLPIQRPSYASQSADTPTTSPTNSPIPRRSCTIRRPAHHVANVFADPGVVKPHNLLAHSPLCQQIHQSRGPVTPRNLPTHPPLHQRIHRSRGNYSYASQSADPLTTSPTNLAIQRPSYAIR